MRSALLVVAASLVGCGGPALVNAPMQATTSSPVPVPTATADGPALPPLPSPLPPPAPTPRPSSSSGVALAARVDAFYANALPFECDLDVEILTRSYRRSQRSRVHLSFARAGRFHVAMPAGAFVAVNAGIETSVDPALPLARRRPVATDHCPIALSYAAGPGVLAKHLLLEAYDGASMNAPGHEIPAGTPTATLSPIAKLVFFVDALGQVTRTLIILPGGDRHRYDVVTCKMHVTPSPALFAAVAPATPRASPLPAAWLALTEPLP